MLKEYLEIKEKEVVNMMMELYDQEKVMRSYIKRKEHDAKVETADRVVWETAVTVFIKGKASLIPEADCGQSPRKKQSTNAFIFP